VDFDTLRGRRGTIDVGRRTVSAVRPFRRSDLRPRGLFPPCRRRNSTSAPVWGATKTSTRPFDAEGSASAAAPQSPTGLLYKRPHADYRLLPTKIPPSPRSIRSLAPASPEGPTGKRTSTTIEREQRTSPTRARPKRLRSSRRARCRIEPPSSQDLCASRPSRSASSASRRSDRPSTAGIFKLKETPAAAAPSRSRGVETRKPSRGPHRLSSGSVQRPRPLPHRRHRPRRPARTVRRRREEKRESGTSFPEGSAPSIFDPREGAVAPWKKRCPSARRPRSSAAEPIARPRSPVRENIVVGAAPLTARSRRTVPFVPRRRVGPSPTFAGGRDGAKLKRY